MNRMDLWDLAKDILTGIFEGEEPDYEIVDEVVAYVACADLLPPVSVNEDGAVDESPVLSCWSPNTRQ